MLVDYFFDDLEPPSGFLADDIRRSLSDKIDSMTNRIYFTKYKRAATPAEREAARLAYLHLRGMSSDFISDSEVNF